ncbi:hypothetical protein G3M74_22690 [Paenibacillus polymyxa]|nr:hypothetical protein [Paenibacillus polymyxa]
MLDHSWPPQKMKLGQVHRKDYEYVRKGSCSLLFMLTVPLARRRHLQASKRRTKTIGPAHPGVAGGQFSEGEEDSARHE